MEPRPANSSAGPAPVAPAIDRDHLSRMTFADAALQREVLALFERQAAALVARMRGEPAELGALAHTLTGSARGVGAWQVAQAAEDLQAALRQSSETVAPMLERLAERVAEARREIENIRAASPGGATVG